MRAWLDQYAYEGSAETEGSFERQIRPFIAFIQTRGVSRLTEITPDLMRLYFKEQARSTYIRGGIERPYSRATLRLRHTIVRIFFRWCIEDGRLHPDHYPMANVPPPRDERKLRHAIDPEDCKRLLSMAKDAPGKLGIRDHALVLTLLGTGARRAELAGMRWEDVHWGESRGSGRGGGDLGYIVVYGKGRKERRLAMGAQLRRALRAWQEHCPKIPGGWVWVGRTGNALTARSIYGLVTRLGDYAGVDGLFPHRFRHTFAAEYTRHNRDIYATKARLGHSDVATTEVYLRSLGVDYGMDQSYSTPDTWLGRSS